jgi:hypothetical protein
MHPIRVFKACMLPNVIALLSLCPRPPFLACALQGVAAHMQHGIWMRTLRETLRKVRGAGVLRAGGPKDTGIM